METALEEVYHALTICTQAIGIANPSGTGIWLMDKYSKAMGATRQEQACLHAMAEEMLAKKCAGRCVTADQCAVQANTSRNVQAVCLEPWAQATINGVLTTVYRRWFNIVDADCKSVLKDCGVTTPGGGK